jgi:hypothetical protein
MDAVAAGAGLFVGASSSAIAGRATADAAVVPAGTENSLSMTLADEAATPPAQSATITTTVRAVNILLTLLTPALKAGRFPYPRKQGYAAKV